MIWKTGLMVKSPTLGVRATSPALTGCVCESISRPLRYFALVGCSGLTMWRWPGFAHVLWCAHGISAAPLNKCVFFVLLLKYPPRNWWKLFGNNKQPNNQTEKDELDPFLGLVLALEITFLTPPQVGGGGDRGGSEHACWSAHWTGAVWCSGPQEMAVWRLVKWRHTGECDGGWRAAWVSADSYTHRNKHTHTHTRTQSLTCIARLLSNKVCGMSGCSA